MTYRWTRIIDSFGSSQADEAAFTELPNGDDLEMGTFVKDGTPTAYEEVWRDITQDFGNANDSAAWILQSSDGLSFLGRIGGIYMGLHQGQDGTFAVRKEVYDEDAEGCWRNVYESGPTQHIPSARDVLQEESLIRGAALGDIVPTAGGKYAVRGLHSPVVAT